MMLRNHKDILTFNQHVYLTHSVNDTRTVIGQLQLDTCTEPYVEQETFSVGPNCLLSSVFSAGVAQV
jgi:hypothetical protein